MEVFCEGSNEHSPGVMSIGSQGPSVLSRENTSPRISRSTLAARAVAERGRNEPVESPLRHCGPIEPEALTSANLFAVSVTMSMRRCFLLQVGETRYALPTRST